MLITFSGLDGAGKSTQIELISNWLEKQEISAVRMWARGGYTPGFELLKRLLRRLAGKRLPPPGNSTARQVQFDRPFISRIWLGVAMFDLAIYWGVILRWQRILGRTVVCDRYLDDTRLDFQKSFPKIPFERGFAWKMLSLITPRPDVALLLWIPVAESLRRSQLKSEPFPDDEQTLSWRLSAYLDEQNFPADRYFKLDCMKPTEAVAAEIELLVSNYIPHIRDLDAP